MVICCVFYITTIPVKIWECTPRARIWNKSIEGSCIDVAKVLNADGVFNTFSDIVILLVPIKALWKLQMMTKRKIGIGLLFTVGLMQVLFIFQLHMPLDIISMKVTLTTKSAPVFSIIGWIVRLRDGPDPDISYNDPEILLWA